jgi:3-oxoacyl-[acyl-carrier-protein] synthase III
MSSAPRRPITETLTQTSDRFRDSTVNWLREPARQAEVSALAKDGFEYFVVSEASTAELAEQAMAAALNESGTAAADIGAVVFSTESFWDTDNPKLAGHFEPHVRLRHALLQSMTDLGLARAFPYGNWLSACANLGSTLGVARALVESGQHQRALVVFADKASPSDTRLMGSAAAVLSDLAVGCVIGPERRGFELKTIVSCAAPEVAGFDLSANSGNELMKFMRTMVLAVKRLGAEFEQAVGQSLSQFGTIIGGHFHPFTLRVLCDVLRIRGESLLRSGRAQYAHAFASDNLVTLAVLEAGGQLQSGQQIVLLNSGVWSWNLILLEKI